MTPSLLIVVLHLSIFTFHLQLQSRMSGFVLDFRSSQGGGTVMLRHLGGWRRRKGWTWWPSSTEWMIALLLILLLLLPTLASEEGAVPGKERARERAADTVLQHLVRQPFCPETLRISPTWRDVCLKEKPHMDKRTIDYYCSTADSLCVPLLPIFTIFVPYIIIIYSNCHLNLRSYTLTLMRYLCYYAQYV